MVMKKYFCFVLLFVLIVVLYAVMPHTSDDSIPVTYANEEEEIVVDETVYKDLPIKNLYVDLYNDYNTDNIYWSKNGGYYYLYLPKGYDRSKMRINFSDKENVQVSVYDKDNNFITKLINNTSCEAFSEHNTLILKTNINSKKVYTYKIAIIQSNVPSVSIYFNNGARDFSAINNSVYHTVSRKGFVYIVDEDGNELYSKLDGVRGRGNATWKRPKKPYQFKLENKADVLGMGSAKTWNLVTNTLDGTLSRNSTFLELAKRLNINYAIDYKPVELYINGKYHGSYLLTEKPQVKENRIEVDESEFLFEIENHPSGSDYVTTKRGLVVTIKNPDPDELTSAQKAKVKKQAVAYLNKVEDAIYGGNEERLKEIIDYDSFAKFYWAQEISENFDAIRGSNYFYTKDGKLYAGPGWDFDSSLNRSWNYSNQGEFYVLSNSLLQGRIRGNWYRALMGKTDFNAEVDRIYYEYYDQINSLTKFLDNYTSYISSSAKMNYMRWEYKTRVYYRDPLPGDDTLRGSVNNLKRYLNNRLSFYKRQYSGMIYKDFTYKYTDTKGKEHEETLKENEKVTLPKNVGDTITIYGDGKELKKIETKDIGEVKLTYSNKTGNRYKKINKITYTFNFERGA